MTSTTRNPLPRSIRIAVKSYIPKWHWKASTYEPYDIDNTQSSHTINTHTVTSQMMQVTLAGGDYLWALWHRQHAINSHDQHLYSHKLHTESILAGDYLWPLWHRQHAINSRDQYPYSHLLHANLHISIEIIISPIFPAWLTDLVLISRIFISVYIGGVYTDCTDATNSHDTIINTHAVSKDTYTRIVGTTTSEANVKPDRTNRCTGRLTQITHLHSSSVQFSSVQFKMIYIYIYIYIYITRSGRPICAPPRLSRVSPMLPLKQFQCWSD